jgi:large subunit ribosomal protein L28
VFSGQPTALLPLSARRLIRYIAVSHFQSASVVFWKGNGMPKSCDVCGKGPAVGNSVTTRGKAKYLGGVGTKITGITRRQFKPNLQRVRVTVQGTNKTIRVCTQCLRSGNVTKLVKAAPFRLPEAIKADAKPAGKSQPPVKAKASGKAAAKTKGAASGKSAARS